MLKKTAICGKGGVGKTTVAAVMARRLRNRKEIRALVVDADPAGGLGLALGLAPKKTLNEVRAETIRTIKKAGSDQKELALTVDYLLLEAVAEIDNLAFLSIGRPEEKGCYCEVNRLLRDAIESLSAAFDVVLIDGEAGIEQVNRQVMRSMNNLLLITDPSLKGLRVAESIHQAARQFGLAASSGIILNRVRDPDDLRRVIEATTLPVIGSVPEDETIRHFDAQGLSFFELPECPTTQAVEEILSGR